MNAQSIAVVDIPKKSVLVAMATKYNMEPAPFEQTLRATVFPAAASKEQFAAFLLVANQYGLNPITREIYAFPAKGGGIVPIVSIDGWINLVNSHKACDGFEFEMEHAESGELISCTCRMFRKDRGRPVTVTEYLSECRRGTEPWKMQHRMLRHKAMIQAARYAFGFSGIYDEDEGEKIAEMRDVTPPDEPPAPPPVVAEVKTIEAEVMPPAVHGFAPDAAQDSDAFVKAVMAKFAEAKDGDELNDIWEHIVEPNKAHLFPPDEEDLLGAYRRREGELV